MVRRVRHATSLLLSSLLTCVVGSSLAQTIVVQPNTRNAPILYTPYTFPVTTGSLPTQPTQRQLPYNPFSPANGATASTSPAPNVSLPAGAGVADDVMSPGRATQQGPAAQGLPPTIKPDATPAAVSVAPQDAKAAVAGRRFTGVAHVVDGNTLTIGADVLILNGADAPEKGQVCSDPKGLGWDCGRRAQLRLSQLAEGKIVRCVGVAQGINGIAAQCRVGTDDLARIMVQEGLAIVPRQVAPVYLAEEASARQAKRGVWVGRFKAPWDVRFGS